MAVADVLEMTPIPMVILDTEGKLIGMGFGGECYYDSTILWNIPRKVVEMNAGKRLGLGGIVQLVEPMHVDTVMYNKDRQRISNEAEYRLYDAIEEVLARGQDKLKLQAERSND